MTQENLEKRIDLLERRIVFLENAVFEKKIKKFDEKKFTREKADEIIDFVCKEYEMTKKDLLQKSRVGDCVDARGVCVYLFTTQLNMGYEETAQILKKDRCTMIYTFAKINDYIEFVSKNTRVTDMRIRKIIETIKKFQRLWK